MRSAQLHFLSCAAMLAVIASAPAPAQARRQASANPVTTFCGQEPRSAAAALAPVKRAERILERVLSTRERVFRAFKSEYQRDRQRIIARNKRLPRSQHMPVPPPRSDDELRQMPEYKKRESKAHASAADERRARRQVAEARAELDTAQKRYQSCRAGILERVRTASSQSAEEIRAIPAGKRLREEQQRLGELEAAFRSMLEQKRKDRKVMGPLLSAAICAHKALVGELEKQVRTVRRRAKLAGTDASADIAALEEQVDNSKLEIVELRRDIKLRRARRQRCGKDQAALLSCIRDNRRQPGTLPGSCERFAIELELLGYYQQPWD